MQNNICQDHKALLDIYCTDSSCSSDQPLCNHPDHIAQHLHNGLINFVPHSKLREFVKRPLFFSDEEIQKVQFRVQSYFQELKAKMISIIDQIKQSSVQEIGKMMRNQGSFETDSSSIVNKLKQDLFITRKELSAILKDIRRQPSEAAVKYSIEQIMKKIEQFNNDQASNLRDQIQTLQFFKIVQLKKEIEPVKKKQTINLTANQKISFSFKVFSKEKLKNISFFYVIGKKAKAKLTFSIKTKDTQVITNQAILCNKKRFYQFSPKKEVLLVAEQQYELQICMNENIEVRIDIAQSKNWKVTKGNRVISEIQFII